METEVKFKVEYTEEAADFLRSLDSKISAKIIQVITIASLTNDPERFKKLQGTHIWEFRCLYNRIHYRLLAFWDTERHSVVIATHGFIKKTQKTPAKEIERAEQIRSVYFKTKGNYEDHNQRNIIR